MMKLRNYVLFLSLTTCLSVIFVKAQSSSESWRDVEPKTVTLFSRTKHQDKFAGNGKSAFSLKHDLRSDAGREVTRNYYELLYGNVSLNGDSDWFLVSQVKDSYSRIKDLGELNWSDVFDVPYLPASVEPRKGIRFPAQTETFEESSNGQVAKVLAGHLYVIHSKDSNSDFYALFRVENLAPSDQVTISWKVVPSPEQ